MSLEQNSVYGLRGYVLLGGGIRRQSLLGALTPDQAAELVFPKAQIRSGAGHNQSIWDQIRQSAAGGRILDVHGSPAYVPGTAQCSATGQSSNIKLAQVSGTLALTGVNIAAMTSASVMAAVGGAAVLGAATLGIGAIIGLFPIFFGHHAAAVKKEQSVLCAATPAANNYLQVIDDAVRTGKATPQQGIDALSSLVTDFEAQVAAIRHGDNPMSPGECNAACVIQSELRGVVLRKQSQYQDLIAAQAPPASSGPSLAPPVTSGSTMQLPVAVTPAQVSAAAASSPGWLPLAAIVVLGFFLVRA